jgi:GR25 family glycosyltransferase involved in LPS biosynthesis
MIHAYTITCSGNEDRLSATLKHIEDCGLMALMWFHTFNGINGETAGLACTNYHTLSDGTQYTPTAKHVSLCINHWFLWKQIHWNTNPKIVTKGEYSLITEDDVRFVPGWYDKLASALQDVPNDWDLLYIGSCYAKLNGATHVKGDVWETPKPNCTHAYLVRHKALPVLIEKCQRIYTNIDWLMVEQAIPHLRTYSILPRIAHQFEMENLPE